MSTIEKCPDCGTGIGMPHKSDCDVERCSVCGSPQVTCECRGHDPMRSIWTGFSPTRKNVELSLKLAVDKRIRAKRQQCYYNAFKTMYYCQEYEEATYVEGVVHDGVTIEHGWIEFNGEILDPTLPSLDLIYFPGLRFAGMGEVSKVMRLPKPDSCEDLPFFNRFGWGGGNSPEFRGAWEGALRYSNRLIEAKALMSN